MYRVSRARSSFKERTHQGKLTGAALVLRGRQFREVAIHQCPAPPRNRRQTKSLGWQIPTGWSASGNAGWTGGYLTRAWSCIRRRPPGKAGILLSRMQLKRKPLDRRRAPSMTKRFWLLLSLSGIACSSHRSASTPGDMRGSERDSLVPIDIGYPSYGFQEPHREVVRDARRWATIWGMIDDYSPPRQHMIDFRKEQVIFVGLGQFGGTGPAITIDSTYSRGDAIWVFITSALCHGHWIGGDAMTAPSAAIRVARHLKKVHFVENTTSFPGCSTNE